jgi:glycosyltransferase involved in cell wall biosynthesis
MTSTIKLLSVIEATTVTGPAKNILNFSRLVRSPQFHQAGRPRVEISIVTFHRSHTHGNDGLQDEERSASPNVFVAAARKEGIEVDVIHESFRFQPGIIRRLRAIVAQRRPDIIQTHMVKSHFLIKLAGLAKKYPWIAYHHGYTTTDLKMQAYNQLNRWSLPSATRVITVCDAFAKQLSRTGVRADRITVCHNSVAAPRLVTNEGQQALKSNLGIAADEQVVLAVGRLSREKGHRDLVDALALLHRMESALKFKLVIVGEGPERESLERASREKGLSAQVLFIDHVEDVAPYYAIADALALPSHSEGSPNVLLEAMAAGVPVVATKVGGVPEIGIDDESALLVPAHEPQLFANALRRILVDADLAQALRANATARVASCFSPESYAESLIRIYQEIVSEQLAVANRTSPNSSCIHDPVATAPGSETSCL